MNKRRFYVFNMEEFNNLRLDRDNFTVDHTIPTYKPCRMLPSIPPSLVKRIITSPDGSTLALRLKVLFQNHANNCIPSDVYLAHNLLLLCEHYTVYCLRSAYNVFGDDLTRILSRRPLKFDDLPLIVAANANLQQIRDILDSLSRFEGKLGSLKDQPLIPRDLHLPTHAAIIGAYILYYPSYHRIRQLLARFEMNLASVMYANLTELYGFIRKY